MTIPQDRLRNFSIIAHIDHGKSTLADRLLEMTHTIDARQMTSQVLDSMDLEREKGITIKARSARLEYTAKDGLVYGLNLIDTPGHVDFAYEVSHSLQACEGAILVVDATQGIEAQTLANVHLAMRENLTLIPVLNKIDLPSADPDTIMEELENVLAIPREEVILASAKDGTGVTEILEAIVARIPAPKGDPPGPLQGLIFDSHYDAYKGVIVYVRLAQGTLRDGDVDPTDGQRARVAEPLELGVFRPQLVPVKQLVAGEVGYIATGLKNVREAQVGDTVTTAARPAATPLPGYQEAKSLVFAGIYPVAGEDYPLLRDALEKLHLNDASFTYEPESSVALGFGFRCGFLGLLHMEIVQERLEREFEPRPDRLGAVGRVPRDPDQRPRPGRRRQPGPAAEPERHRGDRGAVGQAQRRHARASYIGPLMELSTNRRGTFVNMEYLDPTARRAPLRDAPRRADRRLLRPAQEPQPGLRVDGLRGARLPRGQPRQGRHPRQRRAGRCPVAHRPPRPGADPPGAQLAERLKELIPRQMFEIPIQAAIGSNVIARESVRAMRKNVLAKCYGGDITRKRKLLEKQKEGKQRMKRVGSVEIPQEAFLAMLRMDEGVAAGGGRASSGCVPRPHRDRPDAAAGACCGWTPSASARPSTTRRRATASARGPPPARLVRLGRRARASRSCSSTRRRSSELFLGSGDRLGAVIGGLAYGLARRRARHRVRDRALSPHPLPRDAGHTRAPC